MIDLAYQPAPPPNPLYQNLTAQVLSAILIGVSIGYFFPATGAA